MTFNVYAQLNFSYPLNYLATFVDEHEDIGRRSFLKGKFGRNCGKNTYRASNSSHFTTDF